MPTSTRKPTGATTVAPNVHLKYFHDFMIRLQTALHWSAINGHIDICKLLFFANADVDAKDIECNAHPFMCF